MVKAGSPIKEFFKQAREESEAGLGDWEFKAPLELELSTIVSDKKGGGLDIQVVNFGTDVSAEHIQKIKTSIGPKEEVELEEKKARIEIAKKKQQYPLRGAFQNGN